MKTSCWIHISFIFPPCIHVVYWTATGKQGPPSRVESQEVIAGSPPQQHQQSPAVEPRGIVRCPVFLSLYLERTTDALANNSNGGAGHMHLIQGNGWLLPKRAWITSTISTSKVGEKSAALGLRRARTNLCLFLEAPRNELDASESHNIPVTCWWEKRVLRRSSRVQPTCPGLRPIMQKGN